LKNRFIEANVRTASAALGLPGATQMAGSGRIYQRSGIYFIAYSNGLLSSVPMFPWESETWAPRKSPDLQNANARAVVDRDELIEAFRRTGL